MPKELMSRKFITGMLVMVLVSIAFFIGKIDQWTWLVVLLGESGLYGILNVLEKKKVG